MCENDFYVFINNLYKIKIYFNLGLSTSLNDDNPYFEKNSAVKLRVIIQLSRT